MDPRFHGDDDFHKRLNIWKNLEKQKVCKPFLTLRVTPIRKSAIVDLVNKIVCSLMTATQSDMEEKTMKKFLVIMLVIMFSAGASFAGGGKNQSSKGKGSVKTGSTAQGSASQDRAGR